MPQHKQLTRNLETLHPLRQAVHDLDISADHRVRKRHETITLELRLTRDGRLQLRHLADWVVVKPVRCFPWSEAMRFISLRSTEGQELFLIDDARALEKEPRWALLRSLQVAGFLLQITGVNSVEDDFEIRAWKVRTERGDRSFQTELECWPRPSPGGGHLIEDVAGDVFYIPPLESMDAESRRLLWPYVD